MTSTVLRHLRAPAATPYSVPDPVVLVTGAGGGIGAATAHRLHRLGARVVLTDRDETALRRTAATLDDVPLSLTLDVGDPESCDAVVEAVIGHHGRLDAVWANAGIAPYGPLELLDGALWRDVVQVNLIGAYNIIRAALPAVVDARGYVAVTCSWASFAHSPGHSAYAASKAGLEALADSLRSEVEHLGVGVGAFHPGWVATTLVTDKQESSAAFRALLGSLPGPLQTLTPIESVADVLAAAILRRSSRVIYPRRGWALYALRPLLPLRPFTKSGRDVAPEVRRLFADDAAAAAPTRGR